MGGWIPAFVRASVRASNTDVMPVKMGIQKFILDSRICGNDT
jgi:hypothetical protein